MVDTNGSQGNGREIIIDTPTLKRVTPINKDKFFIVPKS
jgi:hypothetical protein